MKRRVLQLIGSFHMGGSEKQAVALTRMLCEEGSFEVMAATLNDEGVLREEFRKAYVQPYPEYRLTSFYDLNFTRQVRKFARFLKDNGIDLIHTHDFYTNVFGMAAARLAGTQARIASKRESGGIRTKSQDMVEKIAFRQADAVLVNSHAVMEHLAARGIPLSKMRLIYNGTEVSDRERSAYELNEFLQRMGVPVGGDVRLVTLVANLRSRVKNIPMLIKAANKVKGHYPETHFIVAGEGELEPELRNLAEHLDVADRVHFIGRCDNVAALLELSYICVLTSTAEGFSNSLIEYMAAGKPVIATLAGGAPEAVVDGETGYLVMPDDDKALARHLVELLSNRELAREMGAAGRDLVKRKFSADAQLANVISLYNDYLEKIKLPQEAVNA